MKTEDFCKFSTCEDWKNEDQLKVWRLGVKIVFLSAKILKYRKCIFSN